MQHYRYSWPTSLLHLLCLLLSLAISADVLAASGDDYKLGSGDLLKISAFGYPDLAADVRVSQSGNITFPLIGQIPVNGLSTREVETLITRRLSDGGFIKSAQVSVMVTEYQSQKVAVMGQVAKPGQYFLDQSSRALDLLAKAGGLLTATAGDQAYVIRHDGSRQDIDLDRMLEGDPVHNPVVADGDTINVPRALRFYIYGQVQRPGDYRLERNMTVSRAISAGGGLTLRGSERRVVVKRRDASGKERITSIKGFDLLKPDDVIFVKESLF
jgi:polysaccharide export outer membrane protein